MLHLQCSEPILPGLAARAKRGAFGTGAVTGRAGATDPRAPVCDVLGAEPLWPPGPVSPP